MVVLCKIMDFWFEFHNFGFFRCVSFWSVIPDHVFYCIFFVSSSLFLISLANKIILRPLSASCAHSQNAVRIQYLIFFVPLILGLLHFINRIYIAYMRLNSTQNKFQVNLINLLSFFFFTNPYYYIFEGSRSG